MCGRFSQFKDPNDLFRRFNLDSFIEGWSDLGLLKPYPAEAMEGYPVSRAVNSPAFNGPECTMPVGEME